MKSYKVEAIFENKKRVISPLNLKEAKREADFQAVKGALSVEIKELKK